MNDTLGGTRMGYPNVHINVCSFTVSVSISPRKWLGQICTAVRLVSRLEYRAMAISATVQIKLSVGILMVLQFWSYRSMIGPLRHLTVFRLQYKMLIKTRFHWQNINLFISFCLINLLTSVVLIPLGSASNFSEVLHELCVWCHEINLSDIQMI